MRISAQGPTEEHVVAGSLSLCTTEPFAFTYDKKTKRKENGLLCRWTSFSEFCYFLHFLIITCLLSLLQSLETNRPVQVTDSHGK